MFWIYIFIEFILPYLIIIGVLISSMLHHDREGINNGFPWEMKSYPTQFMRFPYYQDLKIIHLFDTMYIRKNVIENLWQIIDGRRDKEKIVKVCNLFMYHICNVLNFYFYWIYFSIFYNYCCDFFYVSSRSWRY